MSGRERDDTGHDDDAPIPGLAGLRVDAEPQRDLWPDIAARIAPPRRRMSANAWMSMAAAACVASVIGLSLLKPLPAPAPAHEALGTAALSAPDLRAVPGSRALVKANLQLSRNSEAQIRKALQQDPDSQSLRRLLSTTEDRSDELRRMLAAQST